MSKVAMGVGSLVVVLLVAGNAAVGGAQEVGPANGSLVVVGGGLRDLTILEEFVELAGGPEAPIVVVPTAGGRDEYDQYCPCLRQLQEAGATNLTVLHTREMGDHEEGLGLLRDVAIDQHLLKRNRQFDLIEVIEAHPALLGIGLDENTAIVVRGDSFRVIGASYVAIYDHGHRLDSGGVFYHLAPGDRYNMRTREAFRPRTAAEPLERVVEEVWPQRR